MRGKKEIGLITYSAGAVTGVAARFGVGITIEGTEEEGLRRFID